MSPPIPFSEHKDYAFKTEQSTNSQISPKFSNGQ